MGSNKKINTGFPYKTKFDLYDLEDWYVSRLSQWLPIIPPAEGYVLSQPSGEVLPFHRKQFPDAFPSKLTLTYKNSVPTYPVWVQEDPITPSQPPRKPPTA